MQARAQANRAAVTALAIIGALLAGVAVLLARRPVEPLPLPTPAVAPLAQPVATMEVTSAAVPAPAPLVSASAGVDAGAPPRAPARSMPFVPRVAPSSPSPAALDCKPPFYFDGNKKIFKPSCL